LFALWQNKVFEGDINYPDTFDLRDYASDLQFLQMAKASGVKSETFTKEIDKQIAKAVVDDDEAINSINNEIDSSSSTIEQFKTNIPETEEE